MKSKELNKTAFAYILNAIDPEAYEVKAETDKEKLQFLYNTFISEYWYEHNQRYYKNNKAEAFKNWVMGLPSVFNIDFCNYRILEIAVKWGSIPENANESQQDKILNNWFSFITVKTFQLFRKHKIL